MLVSSFLVLHFEGHLPIGFQTLRNLTEIHAAKNGLRLIGLSKRDYRGPGWFESVKHLDLSSNYVSGSIDLSIFPNLEYADLSNNLITGFAGNGRIPYSFAR
mmetsp:Transcript_43727/g.123886  ORF Transcript_43727/g.123886 Transcript_43727/m.123886 type:complete len:102 (+) Transcript_43727:52-357(+)